MLCMCVCVCRGVAALISFSFIVFALSFREFSHSPSFSSFLPSFPLLLFSLPLSSLLSLLSGNKPISFFTNQRKSHYTLKQREWWNSHTPDQQKQLTNFLDCVFMPRYSGKAFPPTPGVCMCGVCVGYMWCVCCCLLRPASIPLLIQLSVITSLSSSPPSLPSQQEPNRGFHGLF